MKINKKYLAAWISTLVLVAGTVAFFIIYSEINNQDNNNEYKYVEQEIYKAITDENYYSEEIEKEVTEEIHKIISSFDEKEDNVLINEVIFLVSKNDVGHMGYLFEYVDENGTIISFILDFLFDENGTIYDVKLLI